MPITIETPRTDDELTEFVEFADRINSKRGAWWPAIVPMAMPLLKSEGPESIGRHTRPFVAREDGEIVARTLAIVDDNYLARWNDGVGHVAMFESSTRNVDTVRRLMNETCGWLRERGMVAGRAGFALNDFPFAYDAGDTLPPVMLRQNPTYYHTLLKEAGFESERAWVDYRIEVTPELIARWESCIDAARAKGYELVPYRDIPGPRARTWVDTWNDSFSEHWGVAPQREEEHAGLAEFLQPLGMGDTSVMAFDRGDAVGALWVVPEFASAMAAHPDRELRPEERLNFLGIAVRQRARGRGVNMAMASYAYLELVKRGATHVSYTLVLDDNWPSRRTAEKLGASICANYMVYRRNFVR